jgi:two-component system, LytTR family, sensor histidine kinase AlgZ
MHPILANQARLRLYLLAWIPFDLFLIYWPYSAGAFGLAEGAAFVIPLLTVLSFLTLSSWYLCAALPLSRTSPFKLVINTFAAASAMGAFWVLIAIAWASALAHLFFPELDTRMERFYPLYYFTGVLLYLLGVALHYLISSIETSQQAQTLARESQLRALKMQINPHFLFNSLNSISALTLADSSRAREMCIKLSDFLRTTLQLGDREVIPLSEELALCLNYLEVERVRFGSRLTIEQRIDEGCGHCEVPSLIVQPLVENAVKHGISGVLEGGTVTLDVRYSGEILRIRVTNPYDPEYQPAKRNGIGLRNIRQRLEARYGDRARLELEPLTGNIYKAELRLPCSRA